MRGRGTWAFEHVPNARKPRGGRHACQLHMHRADNYTEILLAEAESVIFWLLPFFAAGWPEANGRVRGVTREAV